ncbi:MAG: GDSL-type esterase/lipase family protein [Bacteroidetes bacterium]|nr:GDSL-type esterase/lipase family protein [Bacteroidota bacterium]
MRVLVALIGWVGLTFCATAQLCGQDYEAQVVAIHERAQKLRGENPTLVLVGSSSFRLWPHTDTVFAGYDVINAGFGGSCFHDAWLLRDTLIYAFEPSVVLLYEGDNDLNDGLLMEDILADAANLLDDLSRRLPTSEVVVVAPKASRARYHLKDQYLELNAGLRSIAMDHGAHWVDFWLVQHDAYGRLRDELFIQDQLHLNDAGYAVWVNELRRQLPWLDPNAQ